ncbi:MAG: recombinase family protein, partial [Alphaproteobacteria bacterium]
SAMSAGKFVAYYRVSTDRQGRSGLGLEAQREAVQRFLSAGGWPPLAEYTEVETGKGANALDKRPELKAALDFARKHKATLVIAKLDRLARNVHFISGLIEQRVPIVAADMPDADITMLQIYAVMAEREARVISERTRVALAAAKARGTVLGAYGKVLAVKNQAEAVERLAPIADRLRALKASGLSVRAIAATLNDEGVKSPAGGAWHVSNVHRALPRLKASV